MSHSDNTDATGSARIARVASISLGNDRHSRLATVTSVPAAAVPRTNTRSSVSDRRATANGWKPRRDSISADDVSTMRRDRSSDTGRLATGVVTRDFKSGAAFHRVVGRRDEREIFPTLRGTTPAALCRCVRRRRNP